ncbi:hypothetical protein B0H11DRAFT_682119 [Mycena galericulata]|nr:hypothetical protein B0H11DRAFT_682119 [Mycena galericulata]
MRTPSRLRACRLVADAADVYVEQDEREGECSYGDGDRGGDGGGGLGRITGERGLRDGRVREVSDFHHHLFSARHARRVDALQRATSRVHLVGDLARADSEREICVLLSLATAEPAMTAARVPAAARSNRAAQESFSRKTRVTSRRRMRAPLDCERVAHRAGRARARLHGDGMGIESEMEAGMGIGTDEWRMWAEGGPCASSN